ncbi:tRNA lysidine(34) synthetase TilS [Calycomorphotria hydatis]|uniref:tRNA(Ile)-lysidine synthase n=1 Tax=Calycomorphotria hydatis TaxID=2528027 RepID=A0A517T9K6_9PLAN|nr:tRNA lysidine(34) synthetase TilS [Calycomorphotria hydatis]QDT65051.1 tRNA(Ile)-lysidine synthase [Calycomorphotria hydatis]
MGEAKKSRIPSGGVSTGDSVVQVVASFLREKSPELRSLVIAVSGGADSIALLRSAQQFAASEKIQLTVGHVEHGLRESSQSDAEWVASECNRLGVPCVIRRVDVSGHIDQHGGSVEEVARKLRYAALQEVAQSVGAEAIATAHTADDQAETILFNLLRGTGLNGLCGMPAVRTLDNGTTLIRPLLKVGRQEILAYLAEVDQPFRTDETNFDLKFSRNWIRRELLPLIRENLNPNVNDVLARLAANTSDAQGVIRDAARQLAEKALCRETMEDGSFQIDATVFRDEHRHLVREAWVVLWTDLNWPRQRMGQREWDALAAVTLGEMAAVNLPASIDVRRKRNIVTVSRKLEG